VSQLRQFVKRRRAQQQRGKKKKEKDKSPPSAAAQPFLDTTPQAQPSAPAQPLSEAPAQAAGTQSIEVKSHSCNKPCVLEYRIICDTRLHVYGPLEGITALDKYGPMHLHTLFLQHLHELASGWSSEMNIMASFVDSFIDALLLHNCFPYCASKWVRVEWPWPSH